MGSVVFSSGCSHHPSTGRSHVHFRIRHSLLSIIQRVCVIHIDDCRLCNRGGVLEPIYCYPRPRWRATRQTWSVRPNRPILLIPQINPFARILPKHRRLAVVVHRGLLRSGLFYCFQQSYHHVSSLPPPLPSGYPIHCLCNFRSQPDWVCGQSPAGPVFGRKR